MTLLIHQFPFESNRIFGQYSVFIKNRGKLQEKFKNIKIPLAIHYPLLLNEQPAYKDIFNSSGSFPVAKSASKEIISIPMHPYLTKSNQIKIIQSL